MSNPNRLLTAIDRLLSPFSRANAVGTPDEVLRRYLEAVSGFHPELVEAAVSICMAGELPGYDGRFAPTPPQFATACRLAAERKARRDYVDGVTRRRLPPPPIERSPASRERVRDMVARFSQGQMASNDEADEAASTRAKVMAKANEVFRPDMSADAVMRRLMGYSLGSPESEENAA